MIFFEKIDTQEKAYWLGFLYADGNISSNKRKQKSITLGCGKLAGKMTRSQRN